jgi:hypothetical protein
MARVSVSQVKASESANQLGRRWRLAFQQRTQGVPPERWRCVSIDAGKYEHVALLMDGEGRTLAGPLHFGIRQADLEQFFSWIAEHSAADTLVFIAMEPTGHYYEHLAYAASQRYGPSQVYLTQSSDVARRRADWNQGTYKSDAVDGAVINELLRGGYGRPYRPAQGAYLVLHHLERYRWSLEQASTRLKNQIVRHVDRLLPGLVISDRQVAHQRQALWRDLWSNATPRHLLQLCADPYQLRQQTPESLYALFKAAGYWMTRPYAAHILAAVQALCLPEPPLVPLYVSFLHRDLVRLAQLEQQLDQVETEMAGYLEQTWGRWLRPTGVAPALLAGLVATLGDMHQYTAPGQVFARSGLHPGCHDSGLRQRRGRGEHIVKPGDRHLRRQLLRFTFSMLRRYPALQAYAHQLAQRGKGPITTKIALARKLTGLIYTIATQEVPFDPQRLA